MSRTISKVFDFLIRFIYVVFLLLIGLGILSRMSDFNHHSYIICFVLAAIMTACGVFLKSRISSSVLMPEISEKRAYLTLTVICLAVRMAAVFLLQTPPDGDYQTFYLTAAALAQNEYIPLFEYVSLFPHILGYSTFLSIFFRIFGSGSMVAPIVNILLTTGSGMLLYTLCRQYFGKKAAFWAYILWIICPSATLYNTLVLSEPFYTNLILLYVFLLSRLDSALSARKPLFFFLFCGLMGGCLLRMINASRPIAAVLIIATLIVFCLCQARALNRKSAAFIAAFVAILLFTYSGSGKIWDSYSARVLHTQPSAFPGYSMYVGFDEESGGSYSDDDMNRLMDYYYTLGDAQKAQQNMLDDVLDHIKNDHIDFGKLLFTKLGTLLGNDEGGAYYNRFSLSSAAYSIFCVLSNVFYYIVLILCLKKIIDWIRKPEASYMLIIPLYCVGLTSAQMLVEVAGRYHYSMLPMLILIAASSVRDAGSVMDIAS